MRSDIPDKEKMSRVKIGQGEYVPVYAWVLSCCSINVYRREEELWRQKGEKEIRKVKVREKGMRKRVCMSMRISGKARSQIGQSQEKTRSR